MHGSRSRRLQSFVIAPQSQSPAANDLVRYWQSKRANRIAPSRRDIDPLDIPKLLPHVFMFDVIGNGEDFRYRLIGTEIVAGVDRDSTGALISQLYRDQPDSLQALNQILRRTIAEKIPLYVSGDMAWFRHQSHGTFQAVFLPLSGDNSSIDIVLGGLWVDAAP